MQDGGQKGLKKGDLLVHRGCKNIRRKGLRKRKVKKQRGDRSKGRGRGITTFCGTTQQE